MNENSNELNAEGIKRRSIVKAAAWATPVIAVAVSAPLAASSTGVEIAGRYSPAVQLDARGADSWDLALGGLLRDASPSIAAPDFVKPTGPITYTITIPEGFGFDVSSLASPWSSRAHDTLANTYIVENLVGLQAILEEFDLAFVLPQVDPEAPAISSANPVRIVSSITNYPAQNQNLTQPA